MPMTAMRLLRRILGFVAFTRATLVAGQAVVDAYTPGDAPAAGGSRPAVPSAND